MFCSKCGSEIHENAKFCNKCGNSIHRKNLNHEQATRLRNYNSIRCRFCGSKIAKNSDVCPHCGGKTPNKFAKEAITGLGCALLALPVGLFLIVFYFILFCILK